MITNKKCDLNNVQDNCRKPCSGNWSNVPGGLKQVSGGQN